MERIVANKEQLFDAAQDAYTATNTKLKLINAQIRYTGQYWANKAKYEEYKKLPDSKKPAFYDANRGAIVLYEKATAELRKITQGGKLPTVKALNEQKAVLLAKKNELYESYTVAREQFLESKILLDNLKKRMYQIDHPELEQMQKKKQVSRE